MKSSPKSEDCAPPAESPGGLKDRSKAAWRSLVRFTDGPNL